MANETSSQRTWRAACPNCGAPVEFRSAASAVAVCSFCRSTVVRDGDALRKIGESAELFDDHSPLQLGAGGRFQGESFALVGRLQYRYDGGTWNEWHALFDNGRSGWLSEDNGRYVFSFDAPLQLAPPPADALVVGSDLLIDGRRFAVASKADATLQAAQGELPKPPALGRSFVVADLRNASGEVGTLDYSDPQHPGWSVGRTTALADLAMTGLAAPSEKVLSGRGVACPSCGFPLEVKLSTTQSIVCPQCRAVVDLTAPAQGDVGTEIKHFAQPRGSEPLIPLGSTGALALGDKTLSWQVVGYVERHEVGEDASSWREYLLYHRIAGFTFLVDAQDGWSWATPITGTPQVSGGKAVWNGVTYKRRYDDYVGEVNYVLGEFYWRLQRREQTQNTDYAGTGRDSRKRLNCERTASSHGSDVVWSAGETLTADEVMKAFKVQPSTLARSDAKPVTSSGSGLAKAFMALFAIAIIIVTVSTCSRGRCDDVRDTFGAASTEYANCKSSSGAYSGGRSTSGGSYGGFSSGGGGHK